MNTARSRALPLGFAFVTTSMLVPGAAAQGRSAEDTRIIDSYRLTMPVLQKVLPALYAPVVQSLQCAGVSVRDGAIVFASLLRTGKAVALKSGNASAIAPGVLRDNALLLERNDPELKRLTRNGVAS